MFLSNKRGTNRSYVLPINKYHAGVVVPQNDLKTIINWRKRLLRRSAPRNDTGEGDCLSPGTILMFFVYPYIGMESIGVSKPKKPVQYEIPRLLHRNDKVDIKGVQLSRYGIAGGRGD